MARKIPFVMVVEMGEEPAVVPNDFRGVVHERHLKDFRIRSSPGSIAAKPLLQETFFGIQIDDQTFSPDLQPPLNVLRSLAETVLPDSADLIFFQFAFQQNGFHLSAFPDIKSFSLELEYWSATIRRTEFPAGPAVHRNVGERSLFRTVNISYPGSLGILITQFECSTVFPRPGRDLFPAYGP